MNHSIYGLHEGPVDWLGATPGYVVQTIHVWQTDRVEGVPPHIVIVRLNNGYGEDGTIPAPGKYRPFAERCAEIAANSPDVHHWIVGNEPNHPQEWPGGMRIYPDEYADCYSLCRTQIEAQTGHEDDLVLVAAIAPWCALVTYFGNERGDWTKYLQDTIAMIGEPDGYALHAYTHAHDPALVASEARMDPPFADRRYEFRAYRDFMNVIPDGAPVYITECCPVDSGWQNRNNGWVQGIYAEINAWNQQHSAKSIRCLALYRGIDADRWYFADKDQVRNDWNAALAHGYSVDIDEGDDNVSEWTQIYYNACERGFYDQDGEGALTVPVGMAVWWLEDPSSPSVLNRPEMAFKDAQQQIEVYEGRYSANGFFQDSTGRLWLVSDPVYVQNGRPVRGFCEYMHVLRNTQGGGRLGLVDGEGPFAAPYERPPADEAALCDLVVWGNWVNQSLANNQWVELSTPQVVPTQGAVRLVAQFNNDYAGFAAAHWDVFRIEQLGDSIEPEPGTGTIDYARIRTIMDEALADREPVRWPR